jgi:hypothetical protein|tara:strand:+ start:71 stop:823 length:753 start_codon:yes stop_codon:yes gene_type:complete
MGSNVLDTLYHIHRQLYKNSKDHDQTQQFVIFLLSSAIIIIILRDNLMGILAYFGLLLVVMFSPIIFPFLFNLIPQTFRAIFSFPGLIVHFLVPSSLSQLVHTTFTLAPLGLSTKKRGKPHAILDTQTLEDDGKDNMLSRYIIALPRSQSSTMKQTPKRLIDNGILVHTQKTTDLHWQHLVVLYRHERKHLDFFKAMFVSLIRFVVARLMMGSVDSYVMLNDHMGYGEAKIIVSEREKRATRNALRYMKI